MHCAHYKHVNKILTQKYIKPSIDTGINFFGELHSENIYLSLVSKKLKTTPFTMPTVYPFYLSTDLLKECPFWISVGWQTETKSLFIDPSKKDINIVLKKFEKLILAYIKKNGNIMQNQIIIRRPISLEKYLLSVPDPVKYFNNLTKDQAKKIKDKVKKMSNVEILDEVPYVANVLGTTTYLGFK